MKDPETVSYDKYNCLRGVVGFEVVTVVTGLNAILETMVRKIHKRQEKRIGPVLLEVELEFELVMQPGG